MVVVVVAVVCWWLLPRLLPPVPAVVQMEVSKSPDSHPPFVLRDRDGHVAWSSVDASPARHRSRSPPPPPQRRIPAGVLVHHKGSLSAGEVPSLSECNALCGHATLEQYPLHWLHKVDENPPGCAKCDTCKARLLRHRCPPTTTVTRNAAIGCGTLPLPCRPHLLWPAPAAALHTHFQEALRAWQQDGLGGRLEILLPQRRLRALHTASCALEVVVVLRSACPSPTLSHPRTLSHVVCVAGLIISKAVSRNPPPLTPLPCISAVASLGRLLAPSSPSLRSPPRPMVAPSVWCKANRPQSFVGIRSRGHGAFFGELSCTNRCDHV